MRTCWLMAVAVLALPSWAAASDADRVSLGGDVVVPADEDVAGDVVVLGGDARIDGRVRGDVVVLGGELALGPQARIDGDAVHLVGRFERAEGAMVGGSEVGVGGDHVAPAAPPRGVTAPAPPHAPRAPPSLPASATWAARLGSWTLGSLFLLVVGLLFLNTWPDRSRNLRRTLEAAPGWSLVMGALVSAGAGLLAVLLVVSVVGFLALPFLATLAIGLWLCGLTGLLEAVGDRLPLPPSLRGRGAAFVAGCGLFLLVGLGWTAGGLLGLLSAATLMTAGCMAVGASVLSGLGRAPYGGA